MKKLTKVLILAIVAVMLFGTVYSSAVDSYDTYTYSIDGEPLLSPTAYSAIDDFDAIDMGVGKFGAPTITTAADIVSDELANLYIADRANNRIIVFALDLGLTDASLTILSVEYATSVFGSASRVWISGADVS